MAEHAHFQCESCERVFCTDDARYSAMVEGDSCPSCHVASVTRLPNQEIPEGMTLGGSPEMQQMFSALTGTVDFGNLLIAASRIYPYMSQDFTDVQPPMATGAAMLPNEGRRAAAAVEVTFLMADLIVARMKTRMVEASSPEKKN